MIRVLTAVDEKDGELGSYFEKCKKLIIDVIKEEEENEEKFSLIEILAQNCNYAYIDIVLSELKPKPFMFIAFMHGNEDRIVANGEPFIIAKENNSFFEKSFFVTNSCLSGKLLGPDLISQACQTFIGYTEAIFAFKNEYFEISLKCDSIGIISFLTSDITAYECFERMQKYYSQESSKLLKYNDILSAGILINARESLIFHGNKDLKKEDLFQE